VLGRSRARWSARPCARPGGPRTRPRSRRCARPRARPAPRACPRARRGRGPCAVARAAPLRAPACATAAGSRRRPGSGVRPPCSPPRPPRRPAGRARAGQPSRAAASPPPQSPHNASGPEPISPNLHGFRSSHDRVHRALHKRGRDRLTAPTPGGVVGQCGLVALEVAQQVSHVPLQAADAGHVAHGLALCPAAQGDKPAPAPCAAPMPQPPLRALQGASGRVRQVRVGRARAEAAGRLQRVFEAHRGVPPIGSVAKIGAAWG
jgi:hypothetical protein